MFYETITRYRVIDGEEYLRFIKRHHGSVRNFARIFGLTNSYVYQVLKGKYFIDERVFKGIGGQILAEK